MYKIYRPRINRVQIGKFDLVKDGHIILPR